MRVKITKIENRIVTCEIEDSDTLLAIGKRWFNEDIQIGDTIDVAISQSSEKQ